MEELVPIGLGLRQLIADRGLPMKEVARTAGISESYLRVLLRGSRYGRKDAIQPSAEVLRRLGQALGLTTPRLSNVFHAPDMRPGGTEARQGMKGADEVLLRQFDLLLDKLPASSVRGQAMREAIGALFRSWGEAR